MPRGVTTSPYAGGRGHARKSQRLTRKISYHTEMVQHERGQIETRVMKHLDSWDDYGLLARPVNDAGMKRLVDQMLYLVRYSGFDKKEETKPRKFKYVGSRTRARRIIAFIENFCHFPEGPKAGQLMVLDEFEKKFIVDVFDNKRGTQLAILSMAKKNGKTALVAALVLAFVIGPEATENSQIVSGAMEREQAAIIFAYAVKIINSSPALEPLVKIGSTRKRLHGLALNVEFRALANVAKSTHGVSPIVVILDEIGQVKGPKSDFVDALTTAQGAYDNGLMIVISTQAAEDGDLLSIMIDDALGSNDPHTVCHLYTADDGCELDDEKQWRKANPGLGTFRSEIDMRKLALKAQRMPSFASTFRNFNLNQRVEVNSPFVSRDVWIENGGKPTTTSLKGREVYGALDLASVNDLCSALFATSDGDVYPFFWLPKDGLKEKSRHDKQPYLEWVENGFLMTTPGRAVEYEHVAEFLRGVFDICTVKAIAFDRYNMKHLRPWLVKAGFSDEELKLFIEFGQGFVSMSPAIRELESKLLAKKLRHGNHPVLEMCARNAVIEQDPAGNRKFNKVKASGRIDGMVALAMAIGVMPMESGSPTKKYQMFVL